MQGLVAENSADKVLNGLFPEQRAFIEDESEFKAALCTRRSGKTTADAVYLIREALKYPGANCLYIGLTRGHAKGLMLTAGEAFIPKILAQYNITASINLSELTISLPNGSVIWITGVDATPEQSKKLYGNKYRLAIIDEAGSQRQDIRDLVYMKLRPAMAQGDRSGTIALTGTPENNRGFFYQVTCDDPENDKPEPGWSVHKWSWEANHYEAKAIQLQVAELVQKFPGITNNPSHQLYPMFQQHYLARWVMDRNALVYAFDPRDHLIPALPPGGYTYCAGVDWGYVDSATIVVVAYKAHDPVLYVVDCFKKKNLAASEFEVQIVATNHFYKISRWLSDHDPKTTVDILNRHGIYIEPADKQEKTYAIHALNASYLRNLIKIVQNPEDPKATPLIEELESLVWDKKLLTQGIKREDVNCENHCTDSLLYVWRGLFHYLARPEVKNELDPFERYAHTLKKKLQRAQKEKFKQNRKNNWQ